MMPIDNKKVGFISLANDVANYYKSMVFKSKRGADNSWVIIQKLSEATLDEAKNNGFDGDIIDWVDLIGKFLKDDEK